MSFEEKIIPVEIIDEMERSFLTYSMSVIVSRALPDVRDGLKPVHRRILYTMYERGLNPEGAYRKCADIVGAVLGSYHPHGDSSVYDALVRMAQDFSLRYMMVDGNGNFGSVDGDPPAAYRYTEAKMSKMAVDMLADIDKDTVDYMPNYDDRLQEPVTLPSRVPSLLINGSQGIAVGMATNIPPHNIAEVIDCMAAYIDNPDITFDELNEIMPGPDFPTAGIIMGKSGIRAAYSTGRGKLCVRGRAEIEEIKSNKFRIVITEIPYQVNKTALVKSIADLADSKRIEGIDDVVDYSNREGMKIVVELKKDVNPTVVLNQLYSYTQLQTTFGVIMLALVNGVPKVLNLKQMLSEYIKYQEEVIRRRTIFDLKKAREREHILEGYKIALDFIDEVIKVIRASKTVAEAKVNLTERFPLDDIQAQKIVEMPLGRLTGLERQKIEDELGALRLKIADFEDLLANEHRILQTVKEEALKLRDKYADERRTEITAVEGEVDIEDLIPEEECVLTLTKMGYIKRLPVDTYHAQRRGGRGIIGMTTREEDYAEHMFVCSTHDNIMYFSTFGRVYRQKAYIVPEGSRTSKGLNIINLLPLEAGEKITTMLKVTADDEDKYIVMGTKNGVIKRSELAVYKTNRKGGLNAVNLDEGDELRWVRMTSGNDDLIVATKKGYAIRFNEKDARPLGRTARGVRAISLREGDEVIGMAIVREGATLLTITETGYGRRSDPDDYRGQSRGGKGVINYRVEKYGDVAQICMVDGDEDMMMISSDGVVIRVPVDSVSVFARPAKGVRVMKVKEGERIITVETAAKEEEQPEEAEKAESTESGLEAAIEEVMEAADKPLDEE
ncbi:MAG: DNA gyrase subunit A [Acutalibacteraceae bacterium]|nr:DNA gyrase subunit A [Acutalibacteraceae bacterium]